MSGKVTLVTGGGRGIGRAIAIRLARDGFTVVVSYVQDEASAEQTVSQIVAEGGRAMAVKSDITDLAANRALFDTVIAQFGRLDVLVNNAGIGIIGSFDKIDETNYDRLFNFTKGTYFAMQNAMLCISDNGRIINISSGLTRGWAVASAAYAGSKAAIEQFTRSLSKEVGARGITVNAVLPGVTLTDMTSGYGDALTKIVREISLGRIGEPGDIADIVGFLASEQARWITGQLIVANGGSTP